MAARRHAVILNLDAEYELENPHGYSRSPRIHAHLARLTTHLGRFLAADDRLVSATTAPGSLNSYQGVAWCPTPRALAALDRVGATLPAAPPLHILQRVNDRRFGAALADDGFESCYVTHLEQALSALQTCKDSPHGVLAKRAFGFAGRGQRVFLTPTAPDVNELGWLRNSLRRSPGLVIEPRVERLLDAAIHGLVYTDGRVDLGPALIQRCDFHGVWQQTLAASPSADPRTGLSEAERQRLRTTAQRIASALYACGYFGPFGIDAFRYLDVVTGSVRFRPLVEVNARLTMGYVHAGLPLAPS